MHQSLDLFRISAAMATHAGSRQAVVARNIAHADTPGYAAQKIASFQDSYEAGSPGSLRTTRAKHISGGGNSVVSARPVDTNSEPSPNGNTVSIEQELLNSVAVTREHTRALAIYRHGLTILRTSLGN